MNIQNYISKELNLPLKGVEQAIALLEGGATIPFISRYRKERTGNLNEVEVEKIAVSLEKWKELESRRRSILKSIDEQGKLTEELKSKIESALDKAQLEDLYLPFKVKRKSKASLALEKGLKPIAIAIIQQHSIELNQHNSLKNNHNIESIEEGIEGAQNIVAEWISENLSIRNKLRILFKRKSEISTKLVKGKEVQGEKYKDYFSFSEPVARCKSHRFMALKRGQTEGFLKLSVKPDKNEAISIIERQYLDPQKAHATILQKCIKDAYTRLLKPSLENEQLKELSDRADREAIVIFGKNLKQLFLAAPLGAKRILAIDPGFRSGCKLVCLNEQGNLKHNETIFPNAPQHDKKALNKISILVESYKIDCIALGNGTASRETESVLKRIRFKKDIQVFIVNEAGASIYSASPIARKEFPNYDVTVRGAVSIGRRLMDPMAELVKIDPRSIGVGQYQHDVNQKLLKESLDRTVSSSVNEIGVNVNTASEHLIKHVSGVGPNLAENIITHRTAYGKFQSRNALKKVPNLGEKTFEQCSAFLRIPESKNKLDNSRVHPENYTLIKRIAASVGLSPNELIQNEEAINKINFKSFASDTVGELTLNDIKNELLRPAQDPRKKARVFEFDKNLKSIDNLEEGMVIPGIVSNLTNFGAFIDIGIKENGLVHISEVADRFISDPSEELTINQACRVKILTVDKERKRIGLSIKQAQD